MRRVFASVAVAVALLAGPALADAGFPGLTLNHDKVRSDPAGAFVTVSVKNATQKTYDEIVVTCAFYGRGSALGVSSTTLYSTVSGTTGQDQVRLIGGTSATSATCKITSAK